MERRITFFLGAALICGLLTFAAPADLRRVPIAVSAVYVVLAALTGLELVTEARRARRREPDAPGGSSNP